MKYEEISRFVEEHKQEAVNFLQELVRTPSPTGSETAVAKRIVSKLEEEGFNPEVIGPDEASPNIICDWKGKEGKTLLFNGHIDVFPPEKTASRDPWSGQIEGDKLYGRGSTDMKSGDAAGILAMCFLKRLGFEPKGTLSLGLNCDEEQGGKKGILYCIKQGLLKADFTICMEASEDTIIVDTDGRIAWKVTFVSDSWHAGTRLKKVDALQMAHQAVEKINEYDKKVLFPERYFGDRDFGAVISVTSISAGFEGKTVNMHPAECSIWIDRRYTKNETVESAEKELIDLLNTILDVAGHYKLERLFASARMSIDAEDKDIQECMNAYRKVFGSEIRAGRRNGGGDAVKLSVAYNQKVPQFGPGVFEVLGTDDEHVYISQYLNFIKVYMLFASEYLS